MNIPAPVPHDEDERLEALARYEILDTAPEDAYDRITALAAQIFDAPMSLVTLIDRDRQWFKSKRGIDGDGTSRAAAFCAHTILGDDVMVVRDATADVRFAKNPLVKGPPHIRTYAGAPLITPDGYKVGTLCIVYPEVTEITETHCSQLRSLAAVVTDELELRLALRRAKEARAEAEAANRTKSEFLANMSHEIRTPMNGVIGMLHLVMNGKMDTESRNFAASAHKAANDLLTILNDVLDLSKLESGLLRLENGAVDIAETARVVANLFAPKAEEKGVAISLSVDPEVPAFVAGDGTRIRQILVNLISNAVKFTERGGIDVRLSYSGVPSKGRLRCEVRDTGIGIAEEHRSRLFQRFTQADSSTTRRYGGTGLGLAISHELLDMMKGRIGVQSAPGEGSTFWFTIPTCAVEAPDAAEPDGGNADAAGPSVPPLRVLVAEDNEINQVMVSALLTQNGHDVTVVDNGAEAVQRAGTGSYDVILMDHQMPVMDGLTATREIRELAPPACGIPIVAMTATAMAGDRERFLAGGMDAHVSKPIEPDALFDTLLRLVARRNARD